MLDKLKNLFFVEEDVPAAKGKTEKKEPISDKKEASSSPSTGPSTAPVQARAGKINSKFTDVLLKAMDRANLDGFDYLEYKRSLQNLRKMDMDEATRYQSAFAMAQAMGATPAKLVQAAQHYLDTLKAEEDKFAQALVNQQQKQIGDKGKRLKQLKGSITEKESQIKALQEQIAKSKQEMQAVQKEMDKASTKVANTKADFEASYDNLVGQIQGDIEKMKTYLK